MMLSSPQMLLAHPLGLSLSALSLGWVSRPSLASCLCKTMHSLTRSIGRGTLSRVKSPSLVSEDHLPSLPLCWILGKFRCGCGSSFHGHVSCPSQLKALLPPGMGLCVGPLGRVTRWYWAHVKSSPVGGLFDAVTHQGWCWPSRHMPLICAAVRSSLGHGGRLLDTIL